MTSCCRSLIAYTKGSRILYYCVSYDGIVMKINTNPIRFVWKANKNSQIVSTCCRVAVTDLSTAKHRGNNQARSPEVSPLSSNPCETSCTAPEEMNNHSTQFQHSRRGRVSRSHTSRLPVYYMSNPGHSKNKKERKKKMSRCGISSSEVDTLSCTETSWNLSLWSGWGTGDASSVAWVIVYFCRWSEADRNLKGLCTYPNSPL